MILVLDAGNTRIKWGLWAERFVAQGSVPSAQAAQLFDALCPYARPQQAIGSNVAGVQVREQIEVALKPWNLALRWVESSTQQYGVRNHYRTPGQLGSDRWSALVGARARCLGDALVVDCGTTVTIDALTAEGEFLGGLILPGVELMGRALAQGTAGLPLESGMFEPFPRNTANAVHSGALQAVCGAIERMRQALCEAGSGNAQVLLSGGGAHLLVPLLDPAPSLAPDIVLEGLVEMARA